jgi:hypothetical protein
MTEPRSDHGCGPTYTSDQARLEEILGPMMSPDRRIWRDMLGFDDLKAEMIVQTHILDNPGAAQTARIIQGPCIHRKLATVQWYAIDVEVLSGPQTGTKQFWYLTDFGMLPDDNGDFNQWQWLTVFRPPRPSITDLVRRWASDLIRRAFTGRHRPGARG